MQGLYGLLLGGLISSFIGMTVFSVVFGPLESGRSWVPLATVLVGIACVGALMAGGLFTTERLPWLGSALLWASGFTTLWSLAVSFGAEPRWVTPLALGVAIAVGVGIGWRRFGRVEKPLPLDGEGA
jgi:hypothetical protein